MDFLQPVSDREEKKGFPIPVYDNLLWIWFHNKEMPPFSGFDADVLQRGILPDPRSEKVFTYPEALSVVRANVRLGRLDNRVSSISALFRPYDKAFLFSHTAYRDQSGVLHLENFLVETGGYLLHDYICVKKPGRQ
jgi:hypothetical protein